ncbi:MAG: hypothetical protein EU533_01645 [Promethearchaeota archaeon]|nr:MAG: hypothetical protein EU533_01645 [Candidatus Lokiarchaeota archaeon]
MSSYSEDLHQALIKEGMSEEEIENAIKQKKREFGGFMTVQGMLFLIAKEHGIPLRKSEISSENHIIIDEEIDYDEFTVQAKDVKENMANIVLLGKISKIFRINEFSRKDGSIGMVASFIIQDASAVVKIVVWDEQVKILQSKYFQEGMLVRIIGGYSKMGRNGEIEIHIGRNGKLVLSPENVNSRIKNQLENLETKLCGDINPSASSIPLSALMNENKFISRLEGIVQVEEFKELTLKSGEDTVLLKLIITDSYDESARIILWGVTAENCLKEVKEGKAYIFNNLMVKDNTYTGEKELTFTRKSSMAPV